MPAVLRVVPRVNLELGLLPDRIPDFLDRPGQLRLLFDSIVDYAIYMIDPDGVVLSWNRGAERIEGYTAAEVLGRNFAMFFSPEDQAAGLPRRLLATAASEGRAATEGWRLRRDGGRFWADSVTDRVLDDDGRLIGFVKIVHDDSARFALESAREQVVRAQRSETMGRLTGGVAHDFNNLLTALGATMELIRRYSDDERISRLLDTAGISLQQGQRLVSQLLAFAGKQVLRPEPSDLNELILALDALLRQASAENIVFRLDLGDRLGRVSVDQAQYQAALVNIVVNAREAMPEGGILTIATSRLENHVPEGSPPDARPGPYIVTAVSDTGCGMPPEVAARAVEPFFTTREEGRASGLGLSQAHGFANQSGGRLVIDTEPGDGTTVRLVLPALPSEDRARARQERASILVVEDDEVVRALVVEMLQTHDFEVDAAPNGSVALEKLRSDVAYDVLFTDIVMPDGPNGLELAEIAQSLRPELRVLLASGYTRHHLRAQQGLKDSVRFLPKPYRMNQMISALESLLDFA